MTDKNDFPDRRSLKRLKVQDGVFAVLRPYFTKLGQIEDISRGGLAFCYPVTGDKRNGSFELDIFLKGNGYYLERIPLETISDCRMGKRSNASPIPLRRCGVKFGELTQHQKSELEYLIQNYTLKTL